MALEQTIDMPVKAYNIAVIDDDTAEINMYGEVVSKYPVDWWTGEKDVYKRQGVYFIVIDSYFMCPLF